MDSNSPCKDLLFPRGLNLAQKPLHLVGTVLNSIVQREDEDGDGEDGIRFVTLESRFENKETVLNW